MVTALPNIYTPWVQEFHVTVGQLRRRRIAPALTTVVRFCSHLLSVSRFWSAGKVVRYERDCMGNEVRAVSQNSIRSHTSPRMVQKPFMAAVSAVESTR